MGFLLFLSHSITAFIMVIAVKIIEKTITEKSDQFVAYGVAVAGTLMIAFYISEYDKKSIINKHTKEKEKLELINTELKEKLLNSEIDHLKQLNDLNKKANTQLMNYAKQQESVAVFASFEETLLEIEECANKSYNKIKSATKNK